MMVKFVKNCLDGQAPSYLSDYFQQQTYDVHAYYTKSKDKYLLIKSIPNRLREPSFIRALPILMILYNFIPIMLLLLLLLLLLLF